jgi:CBS domain-containing protein
VKIEEIMSQELIVGYVPGTIKDALGILAKHNVSGMPILKKDTRQLAGVLTRTDIFKNPDEEQLALIMSKEYHCVDKDQDIKDAAELLYKHRIHGLPVINNRKNLVGIISPTDIIKTYTEEQNDHVEKYYTNLAVPVYQDTPIIDDEGKLTGIVTDGDLFKLSHIRESVSHSDMGMGGDGDEWTWEGIRDTVRLHYSTSEVTLPPVPVKEVMIKDVVKAFRNTSVIETSKRMVKNNISHIPIVNSDEKLIGMVTDIDLLACIL